MHLPLDLMCFYFLTDSQASNSCWDFRNIRNIGHQGTCIKGPWIQTMGDRIECGRWRWVGRVVEINGRIMGTAVIEQ